MQPSLLVNRMLRSIRFDATVYQEVKGDTTANWQAFLIVILAGLATGVGIGIAGFFKMAGAWSVLGMVMILIASLITWFTWSFFIYLIGTKIFKCAGTSVTLGTLVRTIGFSFSPGVLAVFVFVPAVGGFIWFVAFIGILVAGIVAVRHALNLPVARSTVTCLTSWFACVIIFVVAITSSSVRLLNGGWTLGSGFDSNLNSIVKPYRFSLGAWEAAAIRDELGQWLRSGDGNVEVTDDVFTEYITASPERNVSLESQVEKILGRQIEETLNAQDIYGFPPVNLNLGALPRLLVVSPRDKIESIREIMLLPGLSLREIEEIEARADELGVSSLIVRLGGFGGVYPSFVSNSEDLHSTINTAVEEWVHQYLAFKPLGFRYVLDLIGVARNYEIATINETVASMVSEEISAIIADRYYPEHEKPVTDATDLDRELRLIRQAVDDYLSRGEIEAAEKFMEEKRQSLESKGYHIRKLNQAYFAWYGTYADEPSSVSPIGVELRRLRGESSSLKGFLDSVSVMTSRQDLVDTLESLNQ
ncbi:MAG: YIP1 family protein [Chloroflexi bacterium]|nr:YIP1 family protein [Chloroflexota bacterium]